MLMSLKHFLYQEDQVNEFIYKILLNVFINLKGSFISEEE